MGKVKALEIPRPMTGLTEFESKLVDLLFKATRTEELPVELLFDVAKQIAPEILKDLPQWRHGTPPPMINDGWWLTKTIHGDGCVTIAYESYSYGRWPHEGDDNVLYLDMNELSLLPNER